MRRTPTYPGTARHRVVTLATVLALGVAALAGCDSEGAQTDCTLDACTVTFDRGVDAKVNVLGMEAKLVGTEGDQATVEVAGERVTLTAGQAATEVGGAQVTLQSVNDDNVVVRIARGDG